jgi:hypothetical protein
VMKGGTGGQISQLSLVHQGTQTQGTPGPQVEGELGEGREGLVEPGSYLVVSVQIQGNPRCGGECSLQVLSAEGKAGSAIYTGAQGDWVFTMHILVKLCSHSSQPRPLEEASSYRESAGWNPVSRGLRVGH